MPSANSTTISWVAATSASRRAFSFPGSRLGLWRRTRSYISASAACRPRTLDDVVGAGVVLGVPVDVAPVRFDLVVPSRDGPVVRPDAIHFCGLIDRDTEVRHKANHTSKPYNRSTTARNTMETKVMAERVGFEPTLPFRVNTLSKRAPSATRPSLRRPAQRLS